VTASNGLRGALTAGEFVGNFLDEGGLSSTICMRRRFLVGGEKGSKESSFTVGLGTCLSNGGLKGLFHIIALLSLILRFRFYNRVEKREARWNAIQ
jgi:hypothetical protein